MASDSKGFYISHGNYEKNLLELLTTTVERYTDVLLVVEGRKIRCHRFILALHSNFLKDLLGHEILEPTITIDGFSYEVVKATIGLIYTGQVATTLTKSHEIIELLQILGFEWFGRSDAGNEQLQVVRSAVPARSPVPKISLDSSKKEKQDAPKWDEITLEISDDECEEVREDSKPPRKKTSTVQTATSALRTASGSGRSVSVPRRRKDAEISGLQSSPLVPIPTEPSSSRASSSISTKGPRRRRIASESSSSECADSVPKRLRSASPEFAQSSVCESPEIFRQLQKLDAKLAVAPRVVLNRLTPSQCELKPIEKQKIESNASKPIELFCAYCDLFFKSDETFQNHQKTSCTGRKFLPKKKATIGFVGRKFMAMRRAKKLASASGIKTCKFCFKSIEPGQMKSHIVTDCRSLCELCNNPILNIRKKLHLKRCISNGKAIAALSRIRDEPSSRISTLESINGEDKAPDRNEITTTDAEKNNKSPQLVEGNGENPQRIVRERSSTSADLSPSGEIMNQTDKEDSVCYCGGTLESGKHSDCYLLYFTRPRGGRLKCKLCATVIRKRGKKYHFNKCTSRPLNLRSVAVATRTTIPATSSPVPNPVPNDEDIQLVDTKDQVEAIPNNDDIQLVDTEDQIEAVPAEVNLTNTLSVPDIATEKINAAPTLPRIKIRSDLTDPIDNQPSTSSRTVNISDTGGVIRFTGTEKVRTYFARKNPPTIRLKAFPPHLESFSTRRIEFDPLNLTTRRLEFDHSALSKNNTQTAMPLPIASFRRLGWIALPVSSTAGPSLTTGQTPQLNDTLSEKLSGLANQNRFSLSTLFANNQQAQQAPVGIVPPYNAFNAPDVELECHICGLVFKTKEEVNLHIRVVHDPAPEAESESPQRVASPIFVDTRKGDDEQVVVEDSNMDDSVGIVQ